MGVQGNIHWRFHLFSTLGLDKSPSRGKMSWSHSHRECRSPIFQDRPQSKISGGWGYCGQLWTEPVCPIEVIAWQEKPLLRNASPTTYQFISPLNRLFFERLGSNSIPVLGLTQDQKFSNSVDNSLTQNTGAKKRWKIVRQLPKVGNFDLFSTKMSQILAWKAFNSGLKL